MAIFLNTDKLNAWIPRLINETERELVIIVPYIKTSSNIYQQLLNANQRGVETILVYRENKLTASEKAKFESIDNLNLMHHPNVHCKCYYNEKYLLLTSMNMYEYSEKNNREMGILLHRESLDKSLHNEDDATIFKDAINEIRDIINGAAMEKLSRETQEEGFEMDIIKTDKEKAEEICKIINRAFIHKKFEAFENGSQWLCTCKNYFDKINVTLNGRVEFDLNMTEERRQEIYNRFMQGYNEFKIQGFKLYWNYHKSSIYLYPNSKHLLWSGSKTDAETYQLMKKGIDELIVLLRQYL